jgi:hypothetical protein
MSHVSLVQGLPSSVHTVPPGLFTTVQPPMPSHVELCWQVVGVHVNALPLHIPPVQTSALVHAAPSLHVLPFALFGFEHVPSAGLQVPTTWHWSIAAQTTDAPLVHIPD